jgi:hypothetical protein
MCNYGDKYEFSENLELSPFIRVRMTMTYINIYLQYSTLPQQEYKNYNCYKNNSNDYRIYYRRSYKFIVIRIENDRMHIFIILWILNLQQYIHRIISYNQLVLSWYLHIIHRSVSVIDTIHCFRCLHENLKK